MSEGEKGLKNPPPPPPYTAQYGADFGRGANPPQQGGHGMGFVPQPGYDQPMQTNTTSVIVNQPVAAGFVVRQPRPSSYMVSSIISCLFCFWPTALCAIYYASRSNALADVGDMEGAQTMANNARNLMITSVILGIVLAIFYYIYYYRYLYSGY